MARLIWIAVPALLVAACDREAATTNDTQEFNVASAAPGAPVGAPVAAPVTDSATYLTKAGAGDLFEIESSRTILDKTANPEIQNFARMMVDEHGKSTAKVKAAAQAAGLTASPPALDPMQKQALEGIQSASGTAADRAYLDAQRKAHDEALALHSGYATGGDTAQLKTAASEIAPVVQHHINTLSKLNAN